MNRWYLQSLPGRAPWILLAALVILVDIALVAIWLAWGQWPETANVVLTYVPFLLLPAAICAFAAALCGAFRLNRFPAINGSFRKWIGATTGTSPQRTPFGPWQPVITDLLPLSILGLISASHIAVMTRLVTFHNVPLTAFRSGWLPPLLIALAAPVQLLFLSSGLQ